MRVVLCKRRSYLWLQNGQTFNLYLLESDLVLENAGRQDSEVSVVVGDVTDVLVGYLLS